MNSIEKILTFLFLSFLSSCAGYEGKNIKLKNFKLPNKTDVRKLSISHTAPGKQSFYVDSLLEKYGVRNEKFYKETKCNISAFTTSTNTFLSCPIITNVPAVLTATAIIPYYCAQIYSGHSTIIMRHPTTPQKNKTLSTHHLKDKAHEVWSMWQFLLAIPITPMRKIDDPEIAKQKVSNKVSEALVRQTLNDALNHKECYKNEADYYRYKAKQKLNQSN